MTVSGVIKTGLLIVFGGALSAVLTIAILLSLVTDAWGADKAWQAQITICKAGPIMSGWDKTCRHEFIRCPTAQACLNHYPSMVGEGEQIVWVRLTSPERP